MSPDFRQVKPIDFFSLIGRHEPLDLLGPKMPAYATLEEKEEAAEVVRRLWARVRERPGVVMELPVIKTGELSQVDALIVLDSLSIHEERKQLTVVQSKNRTHTKRPMFKLSFDPHALDH